MELPDGQGGSYCINRLFAEHPELIAGTLTAPRNYTRSCEVLGDDDLPALVGRILDEQTKAPIFFRANTSSLAPVRRGLVAAPAGTDDVGLYEFCLAQDGQLYRRLPDGTDDNGFSERRFELAEPSREKDRARIVAMLRVKSALDSLLKAERNDDPDLTIRGRRADLNATYDAFTAAFGPLHAAKNRQVLSDDPWYYRLRALELDYCAPISKTVAEKEGVEPRAEQWKKGELFTRRIIKPARLPSHADNLPTAVMLSVAYKGAVDLGYVAKLVSYAGSTDELAAELAEQGLAFEDPETGCIEYGVKYLSGFVRQKLGAAEERAKQDPRFTANVHHLSRVMPANVPAIDIFVPINAGWLPTCVHEDFIRYLVGNDSLMVGILYCHGQFMMNTGAIPHVKNMIEWGTSRRPMVMLVDALLNNRPIKVEDKTADGSYVLNEQETLAAQQKADAIRAAWEGWIHDSHDRREIIETTYNMVFNGFVAPSYDGSMLPLEGCSLDLYPTQKNAVLRCLFEPATLIDHAVGAGKTNTFISVAHELRYINPNERVALIAPNHLISQHATAAQALFPGMDIFVLDKKMMEPATRRTALARLSQSDFDLCIIPLSVSGLIPSPIEQQRRLLEEEIEALEDALLALESKNMSARDMIKRSKQKQAQLADLANRHTDDYLSFADLRISTLMVDESQFAKNLCYSSALSNVAGMGDPAGSKRAFDLYVKATHVLENGGRYIEATGTPILNSIVEAHRHLRLFAREYTKQAGLNHFDAFSSAFAQPVSDYEIAPSGRGYKLKTRISQFTNITELQAIYSSFADVVTQEQLPNVLPKLPDGRSAIPPLANGKVTELLIQPNEYQNKGFQDIVSRFGTANRHANNPLKLMHLGRQLSLDARLVYPEAPDFAGNKINTVVDFLMRKYRQFDAVKGTQIVFMDRSVPARHRASANQDWVRKLALAKAGDEAAMAELEGLDVEAVETMLTATFSLYDELVDKLIARGVPASEIAVIHDYRTDVRKELLRNRMNAGEIRFLIGSTELMGSGLNVNKKLVALVDFDLPLRPGDLIQRHGRIERQGNELWQADPSFEIEIAVPITARTLDAWQLGLLNTKQSFITRFRQLDSSVRHYTEQNEVIDFAELSAIVADDPRILIHVRHKAQLRKLEAVRNNWFRNKAMFEDSMRGHERRITGLKNRMPQAVIDANQVGMTSDEFAVSVDGVTYTKRGLVLDDTRLDGEIDSAALALAKLQKMNHRRGDGLYFLAQYRGCWLQQKIETFRVLGCSLSHQVLTANGGKYDLDPAIKTNTTNGILNAFVSFVDSIPSLPKHMQADIEKREAEIENCRLESLKPFGQQAELDSLIVSIQRIEQELASERQSQADQAREAKAAEAAAAAAAAAAGSDIEVEPLVSPEAA